MKKLIIGIFALVIMFVAPQAFASSEYEPINGACLYGDQEVLVEEVLTSCIKVVRGNGHPLLVTQPWGLTQSETVTVGEGDVVVDEAGSTTVCTLFHGCSDLTSTDFYRNNMIETARQLINKGMLQNFPMFSYWAQFIR